MTLGHYIATLITTLRRCDPSAYNRMCHLVGERTARIQLDTQSVYIHIRDGILKVENDAPESRVVDGEGTTDSATVLALLRGGLEVSEAILEGSLAVHGDVEQINRMFQAIEILLDASPRCPALQKLSETFVVEALQSQTAVVPPRANWYPFELNSDEFELLARYGLIPL